MALNAPLRDAIFRSERPQHYIAAQAGITEARMSKIVRGRIRANKLERKNIVKALREAGVRDVSADDLFPADELVAQGA